MMAISLEKLPSSGCVSRATIGSLMVLAHMISLALVSSRSQQVRSILCAVGAPGIVEFYVSFASFPTF